MSWIAGTVLAVYQGALSTYGAIEGNKAVKRSMTSALYATQTGLNQLDEAGQLERRKVANEASLIRSRLRVLSGESGFTGGGSFADLDRAAAIDEQINLAISRRNQFNQRASLVSRLDSSLSNIAAQHTSPLLEGVTGSLQGFMAGSGMGGSIGGEEKYSGSDLSIEPSQNYGLGDYPNSATDPYGNGFNNNGSSYGGSAYT